MRLDLIEKIIIYASVFSPVSILFSCQLWGKIERKYLALIFLIFFSFLLDLALLITANYRSNNHVFIHLYSFLEIGVLCHYFSKTIGAKIIITIVGLFIMLVLVYEIKYVVGISQFTTITSSLESLVFLTLSVICLYQKFHQETEIYIENNPDFLIVAGILFYFSGSMFSFILSPTILSIESNYSWIFHNIANILKNILFAVGLWKARAIN